MMGSFLSSQGGLALLHALHNAPAPHLPMSFWDIRKRSDCCDCKPWLLSDILSQDRAHEARPGILAEFPMKLRIEPTLYEEQVLS